MSGVAVPPEGRELSQATLDQDVHVGLVTRVVSWVIDALLLSLAAIIAALGTALVLAMFPLPKNTQPDLQALAGVAYVLWCAAYFVLFWSTTGQTPGARVMQIRVVTANSQRVKPARALVRWVGMNLAALPLFAGYLPILFRRRGFPDWLAHTLVLGAQGMSLADPRREPMTAGRDSSNDGLRPSRDARESRSSIYDVPGITPTTGAKAPITNQRRGQPRDPSDPSSVGPWLPPSSS